MGVDNHALFFECKMGLTHFGFEAADRIEMTVE